MQGNLDPGKRFIIKVFRVKRLEAKRTVALIIERRDYNFICILFSHEFILFNSN